MLSREGKHRVENKHFLWSLRLINTLLSIRIQPEFSGTVIKNIHRFLVKILAFGHFGNRTKVLISNNKLFLKSI